VLAQGNLVCPVILRRSFLFAGSACPFALWLARPADGIRGAVAQSRQPCKAQCTGVQTGNNTGQRRRARRYCRPPVRPLQHHRADQRPTAARTGTAFRRLGRPPLCGLGPYPATREEPASLATHTVYRPADLAKTAKLPVVLWANGGCETHRSSSPLPRRLASHGYLVIAVGRSNIPFLVIHGSIAAVADQKDTTESAYHQRSGVYDQGLDWPSPKRARDSPLFGKVDTAKVATMGQSAEARRPSRRQRSRVTTVVG